MSRSVWYNAKIEKIHADGACEVIFLDYGNTDKVKPGDIVVTAKDIPEGEERDKCVDPGPGQDHPERKLEVEVGQLVIARWSEDKVWYRAKILEVGQGSLQVVFTDYGNEEKVEEKNIVLCGADIPAEEESFVDGNVEGTTTLPPWWWRTPSPPLRWRPRGCPVVCKTLFTCQPLRSCLQLSSTSV